MRTRDFPRSLTATELGLAMQPAMAAVILGFSGRRDLAFTGDTGIRAQARELAAAQAETVSGDVELLFFRGRIGLPASRKVGPRSVRKPLEDLFVSAPAG